MSTSVAVVMVLSFLLGLINQGISQGSILAGVIKVPPTWLPYLTIAAGFLGGVVTSLQGVATINGAAIVQALVAGIMALGTAGGGVGVAHHMGTPKRMMLGRNPAPKPEEPAKAA